MNKENPLIQKLISLDLPAYDYAVFGSGPMFAHGIKDLGHDIDLIARGDAWKKALTLGSTETAKLGKNEVVTLFDGEIEIFNGWAPGEWNTDELIDTAEVIDGIPFVALEVVLKWKKMMGREKDFQHIKMIEDYLRSK
jgi:hypothetical protein